MKRLFFYELFGDIAYVFINIYKRVSSDHLMIGRAARVNIRTKMGGYNKIERNAIVAGEIGRFSYIGTNSLVVGKVGKFCSIGGNVTCLTATHPTSIWVSTHPAFFSTSKQCGTTFVDKTLFDECPKNRNGKYSIEIGNDVYIGYGVTIVGPLIIHDGAIIAAGSVVTKDVPPYAIVAGCPARVIRYRFSSEQIEELKKIKWWEKDDKWLRKNAPFFKSIEYFLENSK